MNAAPVVLTAEMALELRDNWHKTGPIDDALTSIIESDVVCRVADGWTGDGAVQINGYATIAQVCDSLRNRGIYAEWRGSEQKVREREKALWGEAVLPAPPKEQDNG